MKWLWNCEPVALVNVVRLICLAGMTFGLHLTPVQLGASLIALEAVLTLITRSQVTPAGTAPPMGSVSAGKAATLVILMALMGGVSACNGPDLPTLLQYAQYGIDADCMFGKNALAADVCTFGGESIALAKAAAANDPDHARAAVKAILISAGDKKPALRDYFSWLTDKL